MKRSDRVTPAQKRPPAEFPFGEDFQTILSLIGDGVVSTDQDGRIILFNRAAEDIFGYTMNEVLGYSIDTLIPTRFHDHHREDVKRFCSSDAPLRRSMGAGREVLGRRKDGRELAIEATLSRQMIGGQHIVTAVVRDVSDRKTVERQGQVVANEVAHRLRNTMAVVDSIVTLTARTAPSVAEFKEALLGRFAAISRTNDSLIRGSWTEASVRLLLETELAPYQDSEGKITLTGPDISIDGQVAVALALVLHELATNAAKYGALSTSAGLLRVDWQVSADAIPLIELLWEERGGPTVVAPTRRGFGSELIARSLGPHGGKPPRPMHRRASTASSGCRSVASADQRTILFNDCNSGPSAEPMTFAGGGAWRGRDVSRPGPYSRELAAKPLRMPPALCSPRGTAPAAKSSRPRRPRGCTEG